MDRRLRLLLFSHSAQVGGSEQVLLQLVRELQADRDVACTVAVPGDGPLPALLKAAGANVWSWPGRWWCTPGTLAPKRARRLLADGAAAVFDGLGAARRLDPDAVLSITTVAPWGALTAALLDRPHLWYVTDFGPASTVPLTYFLPVEDVRRALREGSDRLLVVSEAVRARLFPEDGTRAAVVYPHLDPPRPRATPVALPASKAIRIGVFGNVRRAKGHWDAVSALSVLSRRGLDATLLVVGHAGPEAEGLEDHARRLGVASRVRFVGQVPDQNPWIAASDIVLVPSHEETFSLVCLEALLHGRPLVATRVGGIVEFVEDGRNGVTVRPRDPGALAAALEALIRDPALAQRLAADGRDRVLRRFTGEGFSGTIRSMLDEVVATGRRCSLPPALVAPLDALSDERRKLEGRDAEARALAKAVTAERARAERLAAGLERESARARRLDLEVGQLRSALGQISRTWAWRLASTYWRLARRIKGPD